MLKYKPEKLILHLLTRNFLQPFKEYTEKFTSLSLSFQEFAVYQKHVENLIAREQQLNKKFQMLSS